jgi:SAM-dependent methyltransferase
MTHADETARVKAIYERMAGGYDRMIATWERLLFADGRQWVCSQARGNILEIGKGTGRNLDKYPDGVHIVGRELSPAMLAQALSFASQSFDTVVVTLALCTMLGKDPRGRPSPATRRTARVA